MDRTLSVLMWLLILVIVGAGAGFGVYSFVEWTRPRDEIVKFTAPLEKRPEPPQREKQRMFGVLVPVNESVWTFKVQGKPDIMAAFRPKLDKFLETVKFKDGEPMWDAPKDWIERGKNQFRHATLLVPMGDDLLDVSVSKLGGPDARSVLKNVNRWRGQLGQGPVEEADLVNYIRKVDVGGHPSDFVDLEGFTVAGKAPPMAGKKQPEPKVTRPKFKAPEGWVERKAAGGFAILAFGIVDEKTDEIAEVTVTPLPGPAGGIGANLNRWRQQVGLKDLEEEDLVHELKFIEIAGDKGVIVDFSNPKHNDKKKARITGAVFLEPA
ncbi:MAG: hypothetical protein U0744_09845 [Gemmataceae bacterium]